MKVDKLTSANQPDNWLERITNECSREYQMHLVDIQTDELVIDAGCNVGGFSKAFGYRLNNVLAIDASSYNIEQYQKIHHHPTLHKALYSVDGEIAKLRKYMVNERNDDTNSGNYSITGFVYEENNNGWNSEEWEEVQTISLETVLAPYDEVGLLKIDIEGAEWDFLMGKDLSKIKYITGEFHNFLGEDKHKALFGWIGSTHEELYTDGDGKETHYIKLWKRK